MVHIFIGNRNDGRLYNHYGSAEAQLEVLKERYQGEEYRVYHRNETHMSFDEFMENVNDGDIITTSGIETMFLNAKYTWLCLNGMVNSGKNITVDIVELGEIGQFNTMTANEDKNFKRLMSLLKFEEKRVEVMQSEMKKLGMVDSDVKNYYFLNRFNPETVNIRFYLSVCEEILEKGASFVRSKNERMYKAVNSLICLS